MHVRENNHYIVDSYALKLAILCESIQVYVNLPEVMQTILSVS
jgi:hypothetical protein